MSKLKFFLLALLFAIVAAFSYAYYYFYVEEVSDYYLLNIVIPQENPTKPQIQLDRMQNCGSDSLEIVRVTSLVKSKKIFYLNELKKENAKQFANDSYEALSHKIMLKVLNEAIQSLNFLISIKHTRSYKDEELINNLIKSNGNMDKIETYLSKEKIKFSIQQISPSF